jgi:hypothetical protein
MLIRVQQTVQETLSKTFYSDGGITDPGTVAVAIKRLDGTSITSGTASGTGAGPRTFVLPAQANLDALIVSWTATIGGAPTVLSDVVEIVGGFVFGIGEAIAELHLDTSKYPPATIAAKRISVEQELEGIRRQAVVPRFARFLLNGSGTCELVVPDMQLRAIRAASVAPMAGAAMLALTSAELAAVAPQASGVLIRDDGGIWPQGHNNVLVEYEYGLDMPPANLHDMTLRRLQWYLSALASGVPDRAVSYTVADGGVYRLSAAGTRSTGIPDVDAAYMRDANEKVWMA